MGRDPVFIAADGAAVVAALADRAAQMDRPGSTPELLAHLLVRLTEALELRGAGVAVLTAQGLRSVAASADVEAMERLQERTKVGPGADAASTRQIVMVADVAHDEPADGWPGHRESAQEAGVGAVAGLPMLVGPTSVGAVTLYAGEHRTWSVVQLRIGCLFADLVSTQLAQAWAADRDRRTTEQLQRAFDTRLVIEQAKGIIAATDGVSIDAAFTRLRRHARSHQAPIHDVARAVVELGLRV